MNHSIRLLGALLAAAIATGPALGAVSTEEAASLKSTLTATGAEKAGNKDGSIPEYSGGYTQAYAGYTPGGRRPDPFAGDKPMFSINAQNMAQYADKLSAGTQVLLKRYPDYRLDIYKTVRSYRIQPEIAERTAKNATKTSIAAKGETSVPVNYEGGFPFPIPKTGEEAMWNHLLRQRGPDDLILYGRSYLTTAEGRRTLIADIEAYVRAPNGYVNFKADGWDGSYNLLRVITNAPTIRAGEQLLARDNIQASKGDVFAYLPGQRRVRRLPAACCDSPSPVTAGIGNADDTSVWSGRLDNFDWKLVGKKEIYIPYNTNRFDVPTSDAEVLGEHFVKPEYVRWELHRVWVVEATLKAGQRNTSPKSVYYLDEDSWQAEIADRWDANGQLWKHSFVLPIALPDISLTAGLVFGFYDLLSNTFIINNVMNEKKTQAAFKKLPDDSWLPDAMAGSGVR